MICIRPVFTAGIIFSSWAATRRAIGRTTSMSLPRKAFRAREAPRVERIARSIGPAYAGPRRPVAGLVRSVSEDDDFGADPDAIVKVDNVLVRQPEAAG